MKSDGRSRLSTPCPLPIDLRTLSSGGASSDTLGIQAPPIVPISKLLVDVWTVPSFFFLLGLFSFLFPDPFLSSDLVFLFSFPSRQPWIGTNLWA